MKCPKCGYLGFETTDRCRNCQYDFSLAPFANEPDLTLHNTRKTESPNDFELPPIQRQSDRLSSTSLDLDRLFGDADPEREHSSEPMITLVDENTEETLDSPQPAAAMIAAADDERVEASVDGGALPFDDAPIVPPPAARPPLAV